MKPPPDVLLAVSPLPTLAVGWMTARRLGVPLVIDLQDIWPDAAIRAGLLKNPALINLLEKIERRIYQDSAALIVLSEGFARLLYARGVPESRVEVIPNGVTIPPPPQKERRKILRTKWNIAPDDFLLAYTGNLGLVQDLDVLLDAFEALRDHSKIRLLLMGEGAERARIVRRIYDKKLTSIVWRPAAPPEEIPNVLAAADAAFLSLKAGAYSPGTIPSKLYDYLAAGLPVLNMVEGSAAEVVSAAQAGFNLKGGDSAALRVALFSLYTDPFLGHKMGQSGLAWVRRHAAMDVIGTKYLATLRKVMESA